jgi:hypothetical protein
MIKARLLVFLFLLSSVALDLLCDNIRDFQPYLSLIQHICSRVMGVSNSRQRLYLIALLGMCTLQAQGYVLSSPHSTITLAPNLNAQILKRQLYGATCTEWSVLGGRVIN